MCRCTLHYHCVATHMCPPRKSASIVVSCLREKVGRNDFCVWTGRKVGLLFWATCRPTSCSRVRGCRLGLGWRSRAGSTRFWNDRYVLLRATGPCASCTHSRTFHCNLTGFYVFMKKIAFLIWGKSRFLKKSHFWGTPIILKVSCWFSSLDPNICVFTWIMVEVLWSTYYLFGATCNSVLKTKLKVGPDICNYSWQLALPKKICGVKRRLGWTEQVSYACRLFPSWDESCHVNKHRTISATVEPSQDEILQANVRYIYSVSFR